MNYDKEINEMDWEVQINKWSGYERWQSENVEETLRKSHEKMLCIDNS